MNSRTVYPWSSLVEGDEQLDWPNSQPTMELCYIKKEVIPWHWWSTSDLVVTWSSLVEGDEPNSLRTMELCHAFVLHTFFVCNINRTIFYYGRFSLHLLLLKISMVYLSKALQRQISRELLVEHFVAI